MNQTTLHETAADQVDPAMAERLARMAQRSKAAKEAAAARAAGAPTTPAGPNDRQKKRKHAAQKARRLSLVMSLLVTALLTVTFSILNMSQEAQSAFAALPVPATAAADPSAGAQTATTQTFDGDLVQTSWGPVQVQAAFANGALTDVAVLRYPNDRNTSIRINNVALPQLQAESLTAQSARVDTVSGASITSRGYMESLQSAIDAAQAVGATTIG